MSHTNSTTNYSLPQFIGTDKPTWLNDVNGAFSAIDTQMKANADSATSASTSATTANTNIGTMSSLSTTDKTSLVSAINEVNTAVGTAQSTANTAVENASTAQTSANGANNAISALEDYLNLSVNNSYTGNQFTRTSGTGDMASGDTLFIARNSAGTLAKIYGTLSVSNSSGGTTTFKLNTDTGLRPDSNITIVGLGITSRSNGTANLNVTINTDGTIELSGYHDNGSFQYRAFACLIFVKNFGDTPQA